MTQPGYGGGRSKDYWASEQEPKKLIARTLDRIAWGMASLRATGRLENMVRAMSTYYGRGTDGARDTSSMRDVGEQGEMTELNINIFRPAVTSVLGIVSGSRPAIKPVSTNGDAASAAQARLATGLHEYYERKTAAKALEIETVRGGLVCSAFMLGQEWAPSAGDPVAEDDQGGVVYEGDIKLFTVPPWRYFFEPGADTDDARRWVVFKRRMPRHDLVARCKDPEAAQKLYDAGQMPEGSTYAQKLLGQAINSMTNRLEYLMGEDIRLEDEVWVWELRHLPCPSLPQGRLVRFVEPDIIVYDSGDAGYPYEELHAYEWSPERIVGSAIGHTSTFDIMGLQELHDLCSASIATTVNLLGMPHLWSPAGAAPQTHQLATGPTIIETTVKPELVSFNALKPEVMQAAEWAASLANRNLALNETVMGNPQKGMPASAQALQRAQAVQYHQVAQDEWVRLIEKNANGRLRLLKRFARTQRVAEIAGSAGGWEMAHWQSEDIAGVERFQCEPINPMSATFEGRQAIAQQMGVQGDALFDFMTTGNLKKVTETRTMQLELVERNKSMLMKGIGLPPVDMAASQMQGAPVFIDTPGQDFVRLLKSDPHHIAVPHYLSVVNSSEARGNPQLCTAALDVVQESLRLWSTLTPDEAAAFGIPPLPSTMQPPPMPAPGAPHPAPHGMAPHAPPPHPKTQDGKSDLPDKLPQPPKNPMTGAQERPNLDLGGQES